MITKRTYELLAQHVANQKLGLSGSKRWIEILEQKVKDALDEYNNYKLESEQALEQYEKMKAELDFIFTQLSKEDQDEITSYKAAKAKK